ncbi:hypothetical protein WH297_16345 [Ochrobactrum vermis]|uniref:Uncharacterized protein n=1 Tax=Ochrobactrum vermis TaxID=1827297 RepID=A0ABU8PGC0_9HYPH|nr:hypothetical protein [Ochrobactrum vermis]PQZ25674.1 hypothetical protein CQZ93_16625 [Ochrobactrum vermis]
MRAGNYRQAARNKFVNEGFIEFVYKGMPLPIKNGQTISQPCITASMITTTRPNGAERVIETGMARAAAIIVQTTF